MATKSGRKISWFKQKYDRMIEIDALDEVAIMDEEAREKVKAWFKSFLKDIEPPNKILIFGTKWKPNDMWEFMKVRGSKMKGDKDE